MTYIPIKSVSITDPLSAFGDLRTVELTPQVQVQFPYNINTNLVTPIEVNGGTVTQADSMAIVSTGVNTTGAATLKTIRQIKYRSGLGALARYTTLYTTGVAGAIQLHGIGDNTDGFFFGYNGTTFGIMIRQNNSDTWVAQADWSEDIMDGTGASSQILDHTKLNVFEINYQWLGAGEINFKIENKDTGKYVIVHKVKYANTNIVPSVYNPSFNMFIEATKTSGATNVIMKTSSMGGFVEGKSLVTGPLKSFENGGDPLTGEITLFSLRNKNIYNSIENRVSTFFKRLSCGNDINKLATFKIYLNPVLGGSDTWVDIDGNNSPIESSITKTYTSGGIIIFSAVVAKDNGQSFSFDGSDIAFRPGDIITITVTSLGSGNTAASLIWQEDF